MKKFISFLIISQIYISLYSAQRLLDADGFTAVLSSKDSNYHPLLEELVCQISNPNSFENKKPDPADFLGSSNQGRTYIALKCLFNPTAEQFSHLVEQNLTYPFTKSKHVDFTSKLSDGTYLFEPTAPCRAVLGSFKHDAYEWPSTIFTTEHKMNYALSLAKLLRQRTTIQRREAGSTKKGSFFGSGSAY